MRYPGGGIGLVSGPDGVIAVDLDFLDVAKSARALNIANETLGATPLVRVGQAPKTMLFFRADVNLDPGGRAFGGYELYPQPPKQKPVLQRTVLFVAILLDCERWWRLMVRMKFSNARRRPGKSSFAKHVAPSQSSVAGR
jgi:hypothetical protein